MGKASPAEVANGGVGAERASGLMNSYDALAWFFLVLDAFFAASLSIIGPFVTTAFIAARCRALGPR